MIEILITSITHLGSRFTNQAKQVYVKSNMKFLKTDVSQQVTYFKTLIDQSLVLGLICIQDWIKKAA